MRRFIGLGLGVCVGVLTPAAHAAMTGAIALRGTVTTRAIVQVATASNTMAVDLSSGPSGQAIFYLTELANSPEGFTVNLDADSTSHGAGLALLAEDGSTYPYQVRFAGHSVDLSDGEAQLANVTRDNSSHKGEAFEIVTPKLFSAKNKAYLDHLVLIVKAR